MRFGDISKILGFYFLGFATCLFAPLLLAIYYQYFADPTSHPQPHSTHAFIQTILVTITAGALLIWLGAKANGILYRREGILVVVLIWFLTPAIAALPYVLSGTLANPAQAYFEAVSGLTTTGSSTMQSKKFDKATNAEIPIERVIRGVHDIKYSFYGTIAPIRDPKTGIILYEGVEAVSKAILFWRSFTNWLGGMGIIVLFVAILPALGVGGKLLFNAEMPGPVKDSFTPRIKETALNLWMIYAAISIAEALLLMLTNSDISLLDAVAISFSTLSTGGFSIRNGSIGGYNSSITDWIVILFMLLGSINFSLYYYVLRGKLYRLFDRELMVYLILLFVSCSLCSYFLIGTRKELLIEGTPGIFSLNEAVRYGCFQVISAQTTTGFVTANYEIWPYATQVILLIVMYFGGMAGSTSGGIKIIRLSLLFRIAQYKIESLFRPETVRTFHLGASQVNPDAILKVLCFFLVLASIATFSTFIYIIDGIDPETAFGLVACMINNIGMAFRVAGPTESCAFMSNPSLCLSSFLMILGRLEFFAILAVLTPAFWKR